MLRALFVLLAVACFCVALGTFLAPGSWLHVSWPGWLICGLLAWAVLKALEVFVVLRPLPKYGRSSPPAS